MIDVFVKPKKGEKVEVFFVQLGCIYETTLDKLNTLCDNIVNLYIQSNKDMNGDVEYNYLPVTTYNNLYKNHSSFLFEDSAIEKIHYIVKKVC